MQMISLDFGGFLIGYSGWSSQSQMNISASAFFFRFEPILLLCLALMWLCYGGGFISIYWEQGGLI